MQPSLYFALLENCVGIGLLFWFCIYISFARDSQVPPWILKQVGVQQGGSQTMVMRFTGLAKKLNSSSKWRKLEGRHFVLQRLAGGYDEDEAITV